MAPEPHPAIIEQLRWALVAAPLTPMNDRCDVDFDAAAAYYQRLVDDGADALAVAAHTGRGTHLPVAVRQRLIGLAADLDVPVVAGVAHDDLSGAEAAAGAGADVLLVLAPEPASTFAAAAAHEALNRVTGLPLIAFDLYTHPYPPEVLADILDFPSVVALKPARLGDAIACQEGIAAARERDVLVLSGEDRMLGPSLLWGAEGALVGIASAAVTVTATVLRTYRADDLAAFARASRSLDALAAVTFGPPVDGYVQRMLWIAADEGLIPADRAVDPWRPAELSDDERGQVIELARRCRDDALSVAASR